MRALGAIYQHHATYSPGSGSRDLHVYPHKDISDFCFGSIISSVVAGGAQNPSFLFGIRSNLNIFCKVSALRLHIRLIL